MRLRQRVHRVAQLRLQVMDQRRCESNDEPFNVLGKAKAMHLQRRQDLNRGCFELGALAFDFKLCLTFENEEQLA